MQIPHKTTMAQSHRGDERLMSNLGFRRAVEQLHGLGPRAVGELIADIAQHEECVATVLDLLFKYGRLTPDMVRTAGGAAMPPNPLHSVARRAG